jgi:membrane protein implicated in regulation of membrane protease activity
MAPETTTKVLLLLVLVTGAIGVLDAAIGRSWDLVVLFAVVVVVTVVLLARTSDRRPAMPLRGDLVRWLRARAQITGEPVERIADRGIAAYRASLEGNEDGDGPTTAEPTPARLSDGG